MLWNHLGVLVPFGAFLMVVVIVALGTAHKTREKELQAHADLRTREMEHERRMKELEIERSKIELEKIRASKPSDAPQR